MDFGFGRQFDRLLTIRTDSLSVAGPYPSIPEIANMPVSYSISLPDPALARGSDAVVSFTAHGADAFAEQLQAALADSAWFERWRALQPDPDEVDPGMGVIDPNARVSGEQADLRINLVATTSIPGDILRHRMHVLAGSHWELRNVR
jgi:hypothetical protein